jgi:hypothetical protein
MPGIIKGVCLALKSTKLLKMSTEKERSGKKSKKPAGKVTRPLFETKEHKRAEEEYEEYYNRIRHMSRGRV